MADEPVRVVFHLDQDPRLVGVICSAVEFQAVNAGLGTHACGLLAKAAADVCRATMSEHGRDAAGLEVTLDTFPDRIEIAIHSRGQLIPHVGLETFAFPEQRGSETGGPSGLELLAQVDRVLYNTEDGVARTTLVKFLPARH